MGTASLLILPRPILGDYQSTSGSTVYLGMAKYYDGRKCVVTATLDDYSPRGNSTVIQNSLSMLTRKGIYHTISIVTSPDNTSDWSTLQFWANHGYTEIASESRNHPHAPYIGIDPYTRVLRHSYEWEIIGSRNDILGNLTLSPWWRSGDRQYIYTWIEPFGSTDSNVTRLLGLTHFIADRASFSGISGFAKWDSQNSIYRRVGYVHEVGQPPWGGEAIASVGLLNNAFDRACNGGSIYHMAAHPHWVNWTSGLYADKHTDYIAHRPYVWYTPLGPLYLYHWMQDRNISQVTQFHQAGQQTFNITVDATQHLNYGLAYPITYLFQTPSYWRDVNVYYRHSPSDPWTLLEKKGAGDIFNGVQAVRYDSLTHHAFVSLAYISKSDQIFVKLYAAGPWSTLIPGALQVAFTLLLALLMGRLTSLRRIRIS